MEMTIRAETYEKLRPFLWDAVHKTTGRRSGQPKDPFIWSPTRPEPTVRACTFRPLWSALAMEPPGAQDFPNSDYVWGHPTFEDFNRRHEWLEEQSKLADPEHQDGPGLWTISPYPRKLFQKLLLSLSNPLRKNSK